MIEVIQGGLIRLPAALRSRDKEQPGYISSETMRSLDGPEDFPLI